MPTNTDDSIGKKFDKGKLDWSLVPLSFVKPLVPVFMQGEELYGFENWKNNFDTPKMSEDRRFIAAIKRHLEEVEEHGPMAINEKDGGVYHAAQIAWNALRLLWGALKRASIASGRKLSDSSLFSAERHIT